MRLQSEGYLYIPLGGNRRERARTYTNLAVTMLLGGLWHGANGVVAAVTRTLGARLKLPRVAGWALTCAFVCLGWIFFRARSFPAAFLMVRKVVWLDRGGVEYIYSPLLMLPPLVWLPVTLWGRRRAGGAERGRRTSRRRRVSNGSTGAAPLPCDPTRSAGCTCVSRRRVSRVGW